ncbi:MAG: preprotein translocase subunit SecG, partial [Planctomycetota bacterium]
MGFWEMTLATIFFIVCALLILLVLLQKGRGGGLGAAFGGAGSSAFGTRTGDVFTWVTIVLVAMFLLLAIVSSVAFRPPPMWVAQPRFEPRPPGNIGVENKVKITCETKGTSIYYTVVGTVPDEDSIPYKDGVSVPVQPGQVLKA